MIYDGKMTRSIPAQIAALAINVYPLTGTVDAAELKEACAYHGDLKNTLCAAARTAASFVAREPEFSALFVALYHSARGNDAYKAVRPLVLRLQQAIEQIFIDASADLGNMHGRQRQFSLGFIGLVLYYIVMKQETSKREDVQITELLVRIVKF